MALLSPWSKLVYSSPGHIAAALCTNVEAKGEQEVGKSKA